jgi:hypothetical protein
MSKLEQSDRIAQGVLVVAVAMACASPFALGALKEGSVGDTEATARLFAHLDRDHDGVINWAEAQRVPGLNVVFAQADANHDGSLTHAEFQSAQAALAYQAAMPEPGSGKFKPVKVRGALYEQQYLPSLALGVETL